MQIGGQANVESPGEGTIRLLAATFAHGQVVIDRPGHRGFELWAAGGGAGGLLRLPTTPLAGNGGRTQTHEPRNASGAIDDPMSWLVVVGVILAATLLACWRPARTACRVHPAELLRQD
jgi:hypothetical protein